MVTPNHYRAKADEYGALARTSSGADQNREFQEREKSFAVLADNAQWLADYPWYTGPGNTAPFSPQEQSGRESPLPSSPQNRSGGVLLAEDEERILRALGAALIMQWNTLPTRLRKELFDNAGSMGEVVTTPALRAQIARFLHKHKNGEA